MLRDLLKNAHGFLCEVEQESEYKWNKIESMKWNKSNVKSILKLSTFILNRLLYFCLIFLVFLVYIQTKYWYKWKWTDHSVFTTSESILNIAIIWFTFITLLQRILWPVYIQCNCIYILMYMYVTIYTIIYIIIHTIILYH